MGFAELKGTEKQVKWAKAIRKDRVQIWQGTDPEFFRIVETMLTKQSASSWWITNRDKSLKEACSQLQGAQACPLTKETPPSATKAATMGRADAEEMWVTVFTATGFSRSGPTRDMITGEVVIDATLPF
ncbi:MAG: hypothetical protein FPO08_05230 [Geobacter sp.]|nr:MAG: hypothetical protein FPO08_05230 [Geobacter sp.]